MYTRASCRLTHLAHSAPHPRLRLAGAQTQRTPNETGQWNKQEFRSPDQRRTSKCLTTTFAREGTHPRRAQQTHNLSTTIFLADRDNFIRPDIGNTFALCRLPISDRFVLGTKRAVASPRHRSGSQCQTPPKFYRSHPDTCAQMALWLE